MSSHDIQHPHHEPIPIPDLRFEYSYLRGIKKYVETRSVTVDEARHNGKDSGNYEFEHAHRSTRTEVVKIHWGGVAWVTAKNQIISPLVQGAIWALISYWITPVSASLGSRLGGITRNGLARKKEGKGANWLRSWVGGLGFARGTSVTGVTRDW